jgi:hypothetical protein
VENNFTSIMCILDNENKLVLSRNDYLKSPDTNTKNQLLYTVTTSLTKFLLTAKKCSVKNNKLLDEFLFTFISLFYQLSGHIKHPPQTMLISSMSNLITEQFVTTFQYLINVVRWSWLSTNSIPLMNILIMPFLNIIGWQI